MKNTLVKYVFLIIYMSIITECNRSSLFFFFFLPIDIYPNSTSHNSFDIQRNWLAVLQTYFSCNILNRLSKSNVILSHFESTLPTRVSCFLVIRKALKNSRNNFGRIEETRVQVPLSSYTKRILTFLRHLVKIPTFFCVIK